MNDTVAFILGGGRGTRLYPLTKLRAKPAVPLAGRYRLIDIPVSNCINSGIHKIYVLTQFNSASLNRHIVRTFQFSPLTDGYVEILAAQQTPENANWFQGTADAVRQYLPLLKTVKSENNLILSGDHLYSMDYRPFIKRHIELGADVTISVIPVNQDRASDFGLVKIDKNGRVIEFSEKPTGDALEEMKVDTRILGLQTGEAARSPYIASMGIYVFKREILFELLTQNLEQADFGKEVLPRAVNDIHVQAYLFDGYWEDIGTIETFYLANLELVKHPNPRFSFYHAGAPIYSRARFLPPSKIIDSHIDHSLICEGSIIDHAKITNSVIGIRSVIGKKTSIENTLVMGCDYFEGHAQDAPEDRNPQLSLGIGENCLIKNAIIDKNARIGRNVQILNQEGRRELQNESQGYWIRDGIVIVLKEAVIPPYTVI
jgi:glucose-1-phosphate adenylyltransferase